MNYELAKQLKDAGFPQWKAVNYKLGSQSYEDIALPTLEELVEACGHEFKSLQQRQVAHNDEPKWYTDCYLLRSFIPETVGKSYQTPTEAVANLWLALNKK